jgi:hypothetical protein
MRVKLLFSMGIIPVFFLHFQITGGFLTDYRSEINGLRDIGYAKTAINNIFSNTNVVTDISNAIVSFFRLLFPVEIIT